MCFVLAGTFTICVGVPLHFIVHTATYAAEPVTLPPGANLLANYYDWEDHQAEGMTYRVYFRVRTIGGNSLPAALHVVNLTKDKLEVELLRQQLQPK